MRLFARLSARRASEVAAVCAGIAFVGFFPGCYSMRGSSGGGEGDIAGPRAVNAADVALPQGYLIESVATGLTFPTGIAFDSAGGAYVTEAGYSYGEVRTVPRLLKLSEGGATPVATGNGNGPWNGVDFAEGFFYIAEGGTDLGGRILKVSPEGRIEALVSGLPSLGDHHTNGPAVGPDGRIYFGQGTATNSGVVGTDNADFGWLPRQPAFHDVPCRDVVLAGRNFTSENPLTGDAKDTAVTGAYSPFGVATEKGAVIPGEVPCSGSVLSVGPDGTDLRLVAWGFRNPYGLAFAPDGNLYVTENGFDERGSRPVWGAGDYLWKVTQGLWYGWPDYAGGRAVFSDDFTSPGGPRPEPLLDMYPNIPPVPNAELGVHSSSNGMDFSTSDAFGFYGSAFVAQFGDMAPNVGKVLAPVGFRVVTVDPGSGTVETFAANRGEKNEPASLAGKGGLERPIAVRFSPDGLSLYIVDFGEVAIRDGQVIPREKTGVIWRVRKGAR